MRKQMMPGIVLTLLMIGFLTSALNLQLAKSDLQTIYVDDNNAVSVGDGTDYENTMHASAYAYSTQYPWPMFRHNLRNTGYTKSPAPSTNQTLWNYITKGAAVSSPAVADGLVFIGSTNGKVYALNQYTGELEWNFTTGGFVLSSPAVADGRVYVGSWDRKIYCLDAFTGALIWNFTTGSWVWSSPAVSNGKVYVGSWDRKAYCLNASTGAHIWNFVTSGGVRSSPAVTDGKVYVGSNDGRVFCLDDSTGALIWSYATGLWVWSSPAVSEGRVYVGSGDRKTYCLDAATGERVWDFKTGGFVSSSPAVADGKVYVGSWDRRVYCLDASTGTRIWDYTTGGPVLSSPAVANDKVFVGSNDEKLYCLQALTGVRIWSYMTGFWVSSSPAVADGLVFVGSDDGRVYALGSIVRVPEDYPTIMEAIGAATSGATVVIEAGIYYESLVIDKTLTILGKKGSSTEFAGGGSGVAITISPNAPGTAIANVMITYYDKGVFVNNTSSCKIYDNIMFSMVSSGISVEGNNAANNRIESNMVYSNNIAIDVTKSSTSNTIYNNTISLNNVGLNLESNGNIIYGNTISQNTVGITTLGSSGNTIYWNNFINNDIQTINEASLNTWDHNYPDGGNYWSNHVSPDLFSGSYQNVPGSDGICDNPYIIDANNKDKYPLANPRGPLQKDVAVTSITLSKTVVGQGFSMSTEVAVENQGWVTQTFTVITYANAISINTTEITSSSGSSATLTFIWNTTGFAKGNYTINAYSSPVLGETDTTDNTFSDGWVIVAMVGDITGPSGWPDGKCDIRDVAVVAKLFGVNYPDPRYKPNYDITGPTKGLADGKIDIKDIALIAKHFGEIDP